MSRVNRDAEHLKALGIDKDSEGEVYRAVTRLDICEIKYFYPTTMEEVNDSVYVNFKNGDEMIIAESYPIFDKKFTEGLDAFNQM